MLQNLKNLLNELYTANLSEDDKDRLSNEIDCLFDCLNDSDLDQAQTYEYELEESQITLFSPEEKSELERISDMEQFQIDQARGK